MSQSHAVDTQRKHFRIFEQFAFMRVCVSPSLLEDYIIITFP